MPEPVYGPEPVWMKMVSLPVLAALRAVVDWKGAEEVPELVEAAVAAVTSVGLPREHLHLQGIPAVMAECVALAQQSLGVLTPIVVALLLLIVWLLFRQLWPVLVTGSVAAIGTLWTMGFAVALDPEVNIMLSGVPAIIMIISFSDVVHLCSAYMQLIGDGLAKEEAIRQAGEEVGVACLLTSVTTFCGFAAMMLVPTPVMQQLGLVAGFGVGIALLIALTLVPVMFLYLPTPSPPPREAASSRLLSAVVGLCERVATTRPWAVILGFALLFTISVVGLTQLTIETEFNKRLAEGNHLNVADRFFKETFSGVQPVDLILEAEPGRFKEPATLAAVDGAQRAIAKRPEIGRAVSVTDLLRRIHATTGGGRGALPSTRPMTAQYLLLFEMGGGQDLNKLITPDADRMRVAMFLPGTGFRGVARIGEEAADSMRLALGEGVKVHVNSISHLFGEWLVEILAGQRRGLLASSTVIMLLMMLGLRSVRVGAWSMVPNLLPIIALGGLLGLVYDQVDSDVLMVALIGLGIGVDDTVHFLMRLRIESRKHADPREAIRATFEFAGKPIVKTTLILGLGFAPMALSGYWSLSIMGTLLPFTLVVALLADLLLVPALVQVRAIRFS